MSSIRPARAEALAALVVLATGCAHYEQLAAGEALTVGDGRVRPAIAVELATGSGSSDDRRSVFTEARGRALVGPAHQQMAGLVGLSTVRWPGHDTPLWLHLDLGPGLEHTYGTILFDAIAQLRIGTGFVLAERVAPHHPIDPWGELRFQQMQHGNDPRFRDLFRPEIERRRILLTLALAGDVDARFTREPLYVASLMLGIAHLEEIRHER